MDDSFPFLEELMCGWIDQVHLFLLIFFPWRPPAQILAFDSNSLQQHCYLLPWGRILPQLFTEPFWCHVKKSHYHVTEGREREMQVKYSYSKAVTLGIGIEWKAAPCLNLTLLAGLKILQIKYLSLSGADPSWILCNVGHPSRRDKRWDVSTWKCTKFSCSTAWHKLNLATGTAISRKGIAQAFVSHNHSHTWNFTCSQETASALLHGSFILD